MFASMKTKSLTPNEANFFNNMQTVHSSQTDLETSLFASGYIPNYYYGLSLRFKL